MAPDAVVIGAGPNGLVAANLLADAGWEVVVLEAQDVPGGGVASAGYLGDGFVADVCSAFYPLAAASPAFARLGLEAYGLEWCRAPAVLANPMPGQGAAVVEADRHATAAGLEAQAPGDGAAWLRSCELFDRVSEGLLGALCTPFPPVVATVRLARALGAAGTLRFARLAAMPVRRLGEEELAGSGARLLLAGCTAHTDLGPESAGGALYGWLLAMLGQRYGFPVPRGGAGALTAALVRRLEARGGEVRCASPVQRVQVRSGRAVGVVTGDGTVVRSKRAVLADVAATSLYGELLEPGLVPARVGEDLRRFQWDHPTVKVDWAIAGAVPWRDPAVGAAGTVHLADSVDELTRASADLATGVVPARPFVLVGQAGVADPTRAPHGHHAIWAYTHVPLAPRGDPHGAVRGTWDGADLAAVADRIEDRIEAHAPGFRSRVLARHVMGPVELAAHDANLVHGAINGGTAGLHQQLVLRPVPGLGRPETAVRGLYLCSASAHPGGGVHGACGANAARAALATHGLVRSRVVAAAQRRLG